MCCCGKPSINGRDAYSWDGKTFSIRQIDPPELADGDEVLEDAPGRCGGIDSHSHHFRVVKHKYGGFALLVRHGGGDERIPLGYRPYIMGVFPMLDSNGRYWLMLDLFHLYSDTARLKAAEAAAHWQKAAAEKRIRTRKQPGRNAVKVWIEA